MRLSQLSSVNVHFYMLMPVDTTLPRVTGLYPNGQGFFQRTNSLGFTVTSFGWYRDNQIVVTINGQTLTNPRLPAARPVGT